jgi:hypothetical protein
MALTLDEGMAPAVHYRQLRGVRTDSHAHDGRRRGRPDGQHRRPRHPDWRQHRSAGDHGAHHPAGCAGTPEEAAGAVYLFTLPESDYVSGQTLLCTGGLTGI